MGKSLKQEQLAEVLGVSQALVGDWERGRLVPSLGAALALARFHSVSLDYLVTGQMPDGTPADPAEAAYWKAEAETARANEERAKATEGEAVASRSRAEERAELLQAEVNQLKAELEGLRVQTVAKVLGDEEKRLLTEVADALGVPLDHGLSGVLTRVHANLASAGVLSRPTVHEAPPKKSGSKGQKPRQANSS
ncbi:MAG: helix-turn-helix domain-containing protein [Desulfarculaceae bacterium]|nr:helix-turn-helix domain-containing protein [Desulfarculaceae bacterium]MCF8073258.1 helix-turn-helix domain-containing protein [Desulfarculaceae bacterium]MCF8100854.1 helix-turn-helix domain-containing protein [Desulfarculaceae bacterium]